MSSRPSLDLSFIAPQGERAASKSPRGRDGKENEAWLPGPRRVAGSSKSPRSGARLSAGAAEGGGAPVSPRAAPLSPLASPRAAAPGRALTVVAGTLCTCGKSWPRTLSAENLAQHLAGKAHIKAMSGSAGGGGAAAGGGAAGGMAAARAAPKANKWAHLFPFNVLLQRASLRRVPLVNAALLPPPQDVLDGHSGVAWPQPSPREWDQLVGEVSWETVGIRVGTGGQPLASYFCKQGTDLDKLQGPALATWRSIVDGAIAVAGPYFSLMGRGYAHLHVEGGEGLDNHQDEPTLPPSQCFRVTRRFTSAPGMQSFLRLKHKGTKANFGLPLEDGYNLFEAQVLGVTPDSPWLHGAPKAVRGWAMMEGGGGAACVPQRHPPSYSHPLSHRLTATQAP